MIRAPVSIPLSVAFGASALAHLGLVMIVATRAPAALQRSTVEADNRIDIEAVVPPTPAPAVPLPAIAEAADVRVAPATRAPRSSRLIPHHHSYPVPPDHDAVPHDPRLVHTPGAGLAGPGDRPAPAEAAPTTAPAAAAPEAQEPPRFAMTLGHGVRAGHSAGPSVIAPAGEGHSGDQESARSDAAGDRGEPFGEGDVSERARPIASSLPDYPPAARTAEIEADVELEIVVDAGGRVIAARAVSRNGYGLDEAALRAVERYRFSPARRGGRPVPVRMRWTVQFRLR